MASKPSFPSILNLNVGGIVYTTTLRTITRDPNSLLGRMFSGTNEVACTCDSKGNYFIDRDGSLFRHILNFLRTWELCLPQPFDEFEQLSADADFYQVGDLIKALQTRREDRRRNPPPSDGPSVIFVTDEMTLNGLAVAGHGEAISEVFAGITDQWYFGLNRCISPLRISISKMDAFDLLYRHGFQLEGCNGGASNNRAVFHEYIFTRKNKL
ncbi:BTB/POZ domain-containing protein kctd15-like [Acropora cervicornis]|uniref:BTB/POZ domain-containing protein kctd15-like n=1 Tax=Acropora cervicornis TaxID=6130 RepID=A0AAD9PSZ9_ACRCE|nr:BTB/POZ domain-containing protein kctd15-like [Acropora cervicornis]